MAEFEVIAYVTVVKTITTRFEMKQTKTIKAKDEETALEKIEDADPIRSKNADFNSDVTEMTVKDWEQIDNQDDFEDVQIEDVEYEVNEV